MQSHRIIRLRCTRSPKKSRPSNAASSSASARRGVLDAGHRARRGARARPGRLSGPLRRRGLRIMATTALVAAAALGRVSLVVLAEPPPRRSRSMSPAASKPASRNCSDSLASAVEFSNNPKTTNGRLGPVAAHRGGRSPNAVDDCRSTKSSTAGRCAGRPRGWPSPPSCSPCLLGNRRPRGPHGARSPRRAARCNPMAAANHLAFRNPPTRLAAGQTLRSRAGRHGRPAAG